MLKKLISLIVVLAVLAMPALVIASGEWTQPDSVITRICLGGFHEAVSGEPSSDFLGLNADVNSDYLVQNCWWFDDDAESLFTGTFVEGTRYSLGANIYAKSGYRFASNVIILLNGQSYRVSKQDTEIYDDYIMLYTVPMACADENAVYPLREIWIDDLELPKWGEEPDYSMDVPYGADYALGTPLWCFYTSDNGAMFMMPSETFSRTDGTYFAKIYVSTLSNNEPLGSYQVVVYLDNSFCANAYYDEDYHSVFIHRLHVTPYGEWGDVDQNGTVDTLDALMTLRASMGIIELNEEQTVLADADCNGYITTYDALMLFRTILQCD